jgi:hypothetical protein
MTANPPKVFLTRAERMRQYRKRRRRGTRCIRLSLDVTVIDAFIREKLQAGQYRLQLWSAAPRDFFAR